MVYLFYDISTEMVRIWLDDIANWEMETAVIHHVPADDDQLIFEIIGLKGLQMGIRNYSNYISNDLETSITKIYDHFNNKFRNIQDFNTNPKQHQVSLTSETFVFHFFWSCLTKNPAMFLKFFQSAIDIDYLVSFLIILVFQQHFNDEQQSWFNKIEIDDEKISYDIVPKMMYMTEEQVKLEIHPSGPGSSINEWCWISNNHRFAKWKSVTNKQ